LEAFKQIDIINPEEKRFQRIKNVLKGRGWIPYKGNCFGAASLMQGVGIKENLVYSVIDFRPYVMKGLVLLNNLL